jgi:hypothetical protein
MTRWLALLLVTFTAVSASAAGAKKTHLGVPLRQIVNLSTESVPPDNNAKPLYYDRDALGNPFAVPEGWAFVVTDVFVEPDGVNQPATVTLGVLTFTGGRALTFEFEGSGTKHYPIAGAFTIPGGSTPDVRNIAPSTGGINVQVLGYFVKGAALASDEELLPAAP